MKNPGHWTLVIAALILTAFIAAGWMALRRLKESRQARAVPILMYHKIGNVDNNAWWVPRDVFERQMRQLRNQGYTTILPHDLEQHQKGGKKLPQKPIIITFDDGYHESLIFAETVLKQNGFRAVAYVITDTLAETPAKRGKYEGVEVLIWPEVKAMQQRGTFVFGGHGHRHENMAALGDPYANLRECHNQLRRHGIRRPYSFCYPHGQRNERAVEAVRRAGFRSAVVCEDRVAITGKEMRLMELPRVSVMGGRHAFAILSGNNNPDSVTCLIRHSGVSMDVTPCLIWGDSQKTKTWLPYMEMRNAEYEICFPRPPNIQALPLRLEIWDKHKLFLLFSITAAR